MFDDIEAWAKRLRMMRLYLCREHGICSVPECPLWIMGWEDVPWGRKLCELHLQESEAHGVYCFRLGKFTKDQEFAERLFEV